MKFIMIFDDDTEYSFSGGCFGCVGRTDSYSPYLDYYDVVDEWNTGNDFSTSDDECDYADWRSESHDAKYLVLPSDFNSGSGTEKLYHVTRHDLLDYLINRSPYAGCFAEGSTAEGIISDNKVVLNAKTVSSELVISLGYILRRMCSDEIILNWKAVRSACPELPEFLSLALSYSCRDLYRHGSASLSTGYGDGTLIPRNFSFSKLYNGTPSLSNLSIREIGGYVMNVSGMWKDTRQELHSSHNSEMYNALVNKHSGSFEVQGIFGAFTVKGIKDLRSFLLDVNDLFSKG